MLELCLIGCGGMMPLPYRRLTSLMARYNGSSILASYPARYEMSGADESLARHWRSICTQAGGICTIPTTNIAQYFMESTGNIHTAEGSTMVGIEYELGYVPGCASCSG